MHDDADIQALINELYALISGPAGQPRDWERQRALFWPDARLIRTVLDADGRPSPEVIRIADYAENFEKKIGDRAFYEVGLHAVIERFGCIAHAFSSYEAWADAEHRQFIKRGINSIQLYDDGKGWRITAMVWDDERPGLTMPDRYRGIGSA